MRFTAAKTLTCYCQACGRTVAMSEKFCNSCGAVLGDIQCPKCGYLGSPSNFREGCPKCLYLNPKGNKSGGILRLEILKSTHSPRSAAGGKATSVAGESRANREIRPTQAMEFSLLTNVFILIFLSFGLIGGFLWLNQ